MPRLLLAFLLAATLAAQAAPLDEAALEARTRALSQELRCLVCQNQTIADSQAELAVDLQRQVREQLRAGKSEQDVVRYMTDRYGDFVVYRPPLRASTLLLWFGPAILLIAGIAILVRRIWRMPRATALSPVERERAARLLRGEREAP